MSGPVADELALREAGHRRRVFVDDQGRGTYAYTCTCGKREGDYVHRAYAVDGWREAHGLDPVTNRPLV